MLRGSGGRSPILPLGARYVWGKQGWALGQEGSPGSPGIMSMLGVVKAGKVGSQPGWEGTSPGEPLGRTGHTLGLRSVHAQS